MTPGALAGKHGGATSLQLLVDPRAFVRSGPRGARLGFTDSRVGAVRPREDPRFLFLLLSSADSSPCTNPQAECVGHLGLDMQRRDKNESFGAGGGVGFAGTHQARVSRKTKTVKQLLF